ncbi:EpsG family protein [Acinetobacter sp. C_4_1]|uniref:EpsG family protein n=1 Tax=unclassified Acinetobacter TaxID=196816 RepID=UPI0021B7CD5E|nr:MULTISPECIES: EpsG family protein [unclassified Acinetobacter]MCT8090731.1 EpsG family protein [Acinetobacter sp. F_3_1]MCT8101537.1 EpsG family protein [Acinetobacter sp. C_4_1]MCT8135128.1 EpsG family protein [Acinetobacter sp. T_3_1]
MNFIVKKRGFLALIFSFIFSLFIVLLPWQTLKQSEYTDRTNYIEYINNSINKIYWFDYESILSKLSNEWLWHQILDICTEVLKLNSTEIIFFISFSLVFLSSIFLTKRYNYLSCILLLTPVFVDFMYSQLRLAFVIAILLVVYYLYRRKSLLTFPLIAITPFIHTSALIFISFFIISLFLEKKFLQIPRIKVLFCILLGIGFGILTGPLLSNILSTIGDRRADYKDMSSSVAYMSFWLVLYLYYILKGFFENKNRTFLFYVSLSILSLVTTQTFLGGYPSRYLVAFFPFLLGSMIEIKGKEQSIIFLCYFAYTLLLWTYWINN